MHMHMTVYLIPDSASMLWNVPITIATKSNPEAVRFVLDKASDIVTIDNVTADDWILVRSSQHSRVCSNIVFTDCLQVNPGRQGYYRVHYSPELFSPLLSALRQGSLSDKDRLGLQNDMFALVSGLTWKTQ